MQQLKKIIKFNKTITCLIVNVISSVQINMLINKKLLFQSKLKYCEFYYRDCCFMQCFKCQKYEHTAQIYHQNQKCNFCAISEHDDHSCIFQNESNKYHYVNYEKSHSA